MLINLKQSNQKIIDELFQIFFKVTEKSYDCFKNFLLDF